MTEEKSRWDFIRAAITKIKQSYHHGDLAFYILATVLVYNLIFFAVFPDYGFYTIFPFIILTTVFFIKPWDAQERWKEIGGFLIMFLDLFFDFILSVSYIMGPEGLDWLSLPTLLLDVVGMLVIPYWWVYEKDSIEK